MFYPELIKNESDVQFETEQDDEGMRIFLSRLSPAEVDPSDRTLLISSLDMEGFWNALVRVRSIDWSTHVKSKTGHDEL